MQRYMYIEKRYGKQGLFVPIDHPIEYLLEKTDDSVYIKIMMGNYDFSFFESKPTQVHIDDHYEWCQEAIIKIITWFLSSDFTVFDCALLKCCFTDAHPLDEFKMLSMNYLNEG